MSNDLKNRIIELGLSEEEFDKLGLDHAMQYYKYHHNKYYKKSSVLFIGLPDINRKELIQLAENCGLHINSRISSGLTFLCVGDYATDDKIKKAKENGTKILSFKEFEQIFTNSEYSLSNDMFLYDNSITQEFRIAKPLSNFDCSKEIDSFSLDSENKYSVNLFLQTCNCPDFNKSQRSTFSKGDIRRMCKHLLFDYENSFGLDGVSNFKHCLIQNGHAVKKHIHTFNLNKLKFPVYINYESMSSWWNVYLADKNGKYIKYSYSPIEERFAHNEKPHGFVADLREKLKSFKDSSVKKTKVIQSPKVSSEKQGCTPVLLFSILVLFIFYLII